MTASDCPSREDLTAFHLGDLPESILDAVAAHLETCPRCDQIVRELDNVADEVASSLRQLSGDPPNGDGSAAVPQQVGDYEILGELGRGGMGVVYKARHTELQRLVALKMLVSSEFGQEDFRARFRAEAAIVARLQHPHIVHIIDVGEWRGTPGSLPVPYFTLEYVDGGSLANLLAGKPQPPRQAAEWLRTLARTVDYAHGQGVVHRDLKPSNVLVASSGVLKLCDFGVAKRLTGADLKTRSGLLVGTPEYMAPEQAQGQPAGPATDIYALGAMLYTMLTGRPPHQGASVLDTLEQVRSQVPVSPRRLQPGVPRDLETICLKCLSKEPARRYASAGALADDLERFLNGRTIQARPAGLVERGWKWSRRRPMVAALLAILILVLSGSITGLTALSFWAIREKRDGESALYANRMQLAAEHLLQGHDVGGAERLLDEYADGTPSAHWRGWEWYYLKRLCHPEEPLAHPLVHELREPSSWVQALAYSPDGRRLVSAAGLPGGWSPPNPRGTHLIQRGEVKVWDAATGECLHTFADCLGAAWSVAYRPDGRQIAAGSAGGHVYLWDAETYAGYPRSPLKLAGAVCSLKYTGDSRFLAISSEEEIGLWDLAAGRWRWRFRRHHAPDSAGSPALALHPDGRRLVAADVTDGVPRAWDLQTGAERAQQLPPGQILEMSFSPDGHFLALARGNPHDAHERYGEIWSADGRRLLERLPGHSNNVVSVAFGPDPLPVHSGPKTALLASAGDDRTVHLWRVHATEIFQELCVFRTHTAGVRSLAFNPDGTRLASGAKDGRIRIWDTTRDPRGRGFRFNDPPNGRLGEWLTNLTFTDNGPHLLLLGGDPDQIRIRSCNVTTGQASNRVLARHDLPLELIRSFVFSADGRRVAGFDGTDRNAIRVWNAQTGEMIRTVPTRRAQVLALSADGQQLAYTDSPKDAKPGGADAAAELTIFDVTSGQELCRISVTPRPPASLAFSRDGRCLAVAVSAGSMGSKAAQAVGVVLYDPTTGQELQRLQGKHEARTQHRVSAPDDPQPLALAFSPDGHRLALAGPCDLLRVWDVATGHECSFSPLDAPTALTSVAFSPDGRRLAATGYDGQVRLWDALAGHELLTLRGMAAPGSGHYTFTARVAFSTDGRYLAANDWDGTVFVWDATPRP